MNSKLSRDQIFDEIKSNSFVSNHYKEAPEKKLLSSLFSEMYPDFTQKEIIDSFRFNLTHFYKKNKLPEVNLKLNNNFYINRFNSPIHGESVIEYHVRTNNVLIATFSIYFIIKNKKPILVVNNMQGFVNRDKFENLLLSASRSKLDLLSKELNENWRVFILKYLKRYADDKRYHLRLELPQLYITELSHANISLKEYKRQLRQYIQTALKSGLSINQISLRKINVLSVKENIIANFNLKKSRINLNTLKKDNKKSIFGIFEKIKQIKKKVLRK